MIIYTTPLQVLSLFHSFNLYLFDLKTLLVLNKNNIFIHMELKIFIDAIDVATYCYLRLFFRGQSTLPWTYTTGVGSQRRIY